jgi:hypothetical protein
MYACHPVLFGQNEKLQSIEQTVHDRRIHTNRGDNDSQGLNIELFNLID